MNSTGKALLQSPKRQDVFVLSDAVESVIANSGGHDIYERYQKVKRGCRSS
jgi:hypothetical protein